MWQQLTPQDRARESTKTEVTASDLRRDTHAGRSSPYPRGQGDTKACVPAGGDQRGRLLSVERLPFCFRSELDTALPTSSSFKPFPAATSEGPTLCKAQMHPSLSPHRCHRGATSPVRGRSRAKHMCGEKTVLRILHQEGRQLGQRIIPTDTIPKRVVFTFLPESSHKRPGLCHKVPCCWPRPRLLVRKGFRALWSRSWAELTSVSSNHLLLLVLETTFSAFRCSGVLCRTHIYVCLVFASSTFVHFSAPCVPALGLFFYF